MRTIPVQTAVIVLLGVLPMVHFSTTNQNAFAAKLDFADPGYQATASNFRIRALSNVGDSSEFNQQPEHHGPADQNVLFVQFPSSQSGQSGSHYYSPFPHMSNDYTGQRYRNQTTNRYRPPSAPIYRVPPFQYPYGRYPYRYNQFQSVPYYGVPYWYGYGTGFQVGPGGGFFW